MTNTSMAAPMKTARIGLSFDQDNIENSWFLVDFSKHASINDVAIEIKEFYYKSVSDDRGVVLRINNFLLPSNGSSELFRENDVVSVRLESSAGDGHSLSRKRKHAETGVKLEHADGEHHPPFIPPVISGKAEDRSSSSVWTGKKLKISEESPVEVTGRDIPKCIQSFDEAGIYDTFLANARKAKYERPTTVQKYAFPIIMAGRDLLGCAATGSGKTAAFLLPTLTGMMKTGLSGNTCSGVQEPKALVVASTQILAAQIFMDAVKFCYGSRLKPAVLCGGRSARYQLLQLKQGCDILVGTPEHLIDVLNGGTVRLGKIKYFILDKADTLLGEFYMKLKLKKIIENFGMPGKKDRQTLLFGSTFPAEIQKLAADYLNDYIFVNEGVAAEVKTDVVQQVFELNRLEKRDKLIEVLTDSGPDKTLVYVEQKRIANSLAAFLSDSGFNAISIHGVKAKNFKNGNVQILVAAAETAYHLDIPFVKHVVSYDLPKYIDEYVHRIERSCRGGNLVQATSFFTHKEDSGIADALVKILTQACQVVPDWLKTCADSSFSTAGCVQGSERDIRKEMQKSPDKVEDTKFSSDFGDYIRGHHKGKKVKRKESHSNSDIQCQLETSDPKFSDNVLPNDGMELKKSKTKKKKQKEKHSNSDTECQPEKTDPKNKYTSSDNVLPDDDEIELKKSKTKKKKQKGKHSDSDTECQPETTDPDDGGNESKKSKTKKKKQNEKSEIESPSVHLSNDKDSDFKDEHPSVAVSRVTQNFIDSQAEESQINEDSLSQSDISSKDIDEKKRRKRHRNRKRKSSLCNSAKSTMDTTPDSCSSGINDFLQRYAETEVDRTVTGLYGALPDKLEPPKYYRHGYRNLNRYAVEANAHKRFGADSDSEEEEKSTQQYNFLCKSRKTSDTIIQGDEEFPKTTEDNSQGENIPTETVFNGETQTDKLMYSQNSSCLSENGFNEQSEHPEEGSFKSNEVMEQSEQSSFSAVPFNYADLSSEGKIWGNQADTHTDAAGSIVSVNTSPVTLERKTLTNGVAVFVRQRASPSSRFRELSKQEQLDTTATNVSTIFENPPASQFKVPASPAPKLKPSPHPGIATAKDSLIQKHSETMNGTDLTNLKPLTGAPKPGDTIAYKVLEISASCTPEVSDYKVAKVLNVDDKQMLELKHLNRQDKQKTKFHVEIEDDDEILTNTEGEEDVVWLHQSSLLQPGIIVSDSA